jgi:hypothetical protein
MKSTTLRVFSILTLTFILIGFSKTFSQTITTTSVNSTVICRGRLINVNFTTNGAFQAGSYYKIQLSNASGIFSGNYIGELELQNSTSSNSVVSRTISGEIQSSIAPGNGYKVRVVYFVNSNTPTIVGTTCSSNISIVSSQVTPTFSLPTSICSGMPLTLPTVSTNGISGTWSPASNNTITPNTTTNYIFTPTTGFCAKTVTGTFVVNPHVTLDTVVASCQSYTWPVNGQTYTTSGNYTSVVGCTERILHLTISQPTALGLPGFSSVVQTGLCSAGTTNPTYSILPVSGATSYEWTVPTGTTISTGQGSTSITLNVANDFTSGLLSVKAVNGCTTSASRTMSIFSVLPTPGLMTGETRGLCSQGLSSNTYSVPTFTGASDYLWTLPTGTEVVSGQGSNVITLNFTSSFTTGSLSVEARNVCGSSVKRTILLYSVPLAPGLISGPCHGLGTNGVTTATYSITNSLGATDYLWTVPTGATIVSGQGTNTITLNFTSSFTSGSLSVEARNACGSSLKRTMALYSVPLAPGLITGATRGLCSAGISTTTYSIANVLGATDYLWTVPAGATIVSGQGTTTITLNFTSSFSTGNLSVEARNACGSSPKRTVVLYSVPLAPGLITGTTIGLGTNGIATTTYTISSVAGATDYLWTIPAGVEIVSGEGTNSITLNFTSSFTSGSLSVEARNGCGSSPKRAVTLYSVPLIPGAISGVSNNLCTSGISNPTYTIPAVTGATCYTWTAPAGTTIVSGQGTTSVTLSISGSFTLGVLQVVANNGCGSSAVRSLTLNSTPSTPTSITGSTAPCGTETYTCTTVAQAVSYTWTVPAGMVIVSGQGTNSITVDVTSTTVSGSITVKASNNCKTGAAKSLLISACGARTRLTTTEDESIEDVTTAINTASNIDAVVYPNPTSGEVNIEFTNELEKNATVELYDMIGNKVSRVEMPAGSTVGNLTLEGMTSGMYLLQVVNSNNDILYKAKVSKQ